MAYSNLICRACGHIGEPQQMGFGQRLIGCGLFFVGVLPGLLFFMLAMQRFPCCAGCENKGTLVPLASPVGQRLVNRIDSEAVGRNVVELTEADVEYARTPWVVNAVFCVVLLVAVIGYVMLA